jgi:hypothetical protein
MFQRSALVIALIATLATATGAQQPTPQPKATEPNAATPPAPSRFAQLANVKLQLTIIDQRPTGSTAPNTITLVVADRESARVRSGNRDDLILNVDARPEIVAAGRVRAYISLEYRPAQLADKQPVSMVTKSLSAILEDGKPLVVSESVDPVANRTVRVEARATILR